MRQNPYIPDYWSPEQALAVYEFLDELRERVSDRYGEQITERMRFEYEELRPPAYPHSPPRSRPALRHACACHLLAEGLSLDAIGDHLGHRSLSSTRHYAKVDVAGLREVARFDLGGLL